VARIQADCESVRDHPTVCYDSAAADGSVAAAAACGSSAAAGTCAGLPRASPGPLQLRQPQLLQLSGTPTSAGRTPTLVRRCSAEDRWESEIFEGMKSRLSWSLQSLSVHQSEDSRQQQSCWRWWRRCLDAGEILRSAPSARD